MDLPRTGIEYAHWTLTADVDLDGAPQVAIVPVGTIPEETDWAALEWAGEQTVTGSTRSREARLLLAGPSATNPGAAKVIALGRHGAWVRLADTPEVIVRQAGRLTVN